MAQLNPSNVVNGNIVEANDILQLYDALTAGGGTTGAYDISISGSLTGSATSASYASTALSASYASTALSASFAVSSSRTVTASLALNADVSTYTNAVLSPSVLPSGSNPISYFLKVAAGSLVMTGSVATTAVNDELKGKVLGDTLFVNATVFAPGGAANSVGVRAFNAGTGQIQFQTGGGTGTEFVMWIAFYKPA